MQNQRIVKAEAHCDGPCGIYDPASARIAVEAVVSMTKKLLDLEPPDHSNKDNFTAYLNTFSRYSQVKEEQAHIAKTELLVLWTDYFKEPHLETYPQLHDLFWKAAKLCSACKVEVSQDRADELLACVKEIHDIFWATKNKEVPWVLAG
ncbi:MAG: superoxide dismutase, Ni [Proteobacteria bacterium]|nr:MAG: superoxide dismutase, Ni [Pseudomonadota bacterium]PIE64811.1 MAG: superoxide dismutase, Ni [Desulfobacterales bacterium]